jgi:hypothetical protein
MQPTFTETPNGFLLTADGLDYVLTWIGEKLLVTGPDTCYYLVETVRGLEKVTCGLSVSTLFIPN